MGLKENQKQAMLSDEIIPHREDGLSLDKISRGAITSKMAEDLLAIKNDALLEDEHIDFKCKNLEKALRSKLKINERSLKESDLDNLQELYLSNNETFNLRLNPLVWLKNWKEKTNDFGISNISPLKKMNQIEKLDLAYNNVSDITPLNGMTQMKSLCLGSNKISDISALEGYLK